MQLSAILNAAVLGLATTAVADSYSLASTCNRSTKRCAYNAEFTTKYGKYPVSGYDGCSNPRNVPSMTDLCIDKKGGRGHFKFRGQNKRCLKRTTNQRSYIGYTNNDIYWMVWTEVKCTW